ncbi:MAG: pyridoxine 5'-phosphate synthase [Verrucomicrobiae bacterium]|nr:pyridoxine 5'-phosphate synthase [Verrucomicrobiae bacterium]
MKRRKTPTAVKPRPPVRRQPAAAARLARAGAGSLLLGVNIDHVATLRQARYATMLDSPNAEPSLLAAAHEAEAHGADSITIHLRQDRRHIQDRDVFELREKIHTKLNLEMGNTQEILNVALKAKPDFVCLVPENRREITTEGGLDVAGANRSLRRTIDALREARIRVSLFIDPAREQVEAAAKTGAEMIELHTGAFANAALGGGDDELAALVAAAETARAAGLQVNAGHGINLLNLVKLMRVPHLAELNVGHHLVSRGVFLGLGRAVREMKEMMKSHGAV